MKIRMLFRAVLPAFMAVFALFGTQAFAQEQVSPGLMSTYRGAEGKILATTPWGNLTEAGLYTYLLMTRLDTPLLYQQYGQAPAGPDKTALRVRLENAIRTWAAEQALAQEGAALGDPLDKVRLRFLEHPVHELFWIDNYIAPKVKVTPEDTRKYMLEHPEISLQPGKVQVRCIFLRLDPKADTTAVRTVETRMSEIREEIVSGKIAFEDAARKYSEAPSAVEGGLMPEFSEGTHFVNFEDQAFSLEKGEVSPIVYGVDGLYLLQGVQRIPAKATTSLPVEEIVHRRLYFTQLQHRHAYELWKLRSIAIIENKAGIIDTMHPNAIALKANGFELTRDQIWTLLPEFSGTSFVLNKGLLASQMDRAISMELIAQFNEKSKMDWQPPLAAAHQAALVFLKAQNRLMEMVRQHAPSTPEALQQYVASHSEAFAQAMGTRFSLVQVRLVDSKRISPTRRQWELDRMRQAMEGLRDSALANSLEETAQQWQGRETHPADLIPMRLAEELSRQTNESTEVMRWDSSQSDQLLPAKIRELVVKVRAELPKHLAAKTRFLPIVEDEKSLTLFYVEQPDWTKPGIAKVFNFALQRQAARFVAGEVLEKVKAEKLGEGRLVLQLEP